MNNSMVAHLWANEKKESARGSNLFFEGRSIYSYGYHFEVAHTDSKNHDHLSPPLTKKGFVSPPSSYRL